uniref:Uncharacterized protein n=1 Tax=Arundo donax TaxID=35708 RepID=A0A0A9B055_ARUDO
MRDGRLMNVQEGSRQRVLRWPQGFYEGWPRCSKNQKESVMITIYMMSMC